jgi:hypothetical protein
MRRISCLGSITLILLMATSPVAAQTGPSRIAGLVKNGQKVSIVDDEGRELEGRIDGVSADSLGIVVKGRRLDLPVERIVKIDHPYDGLGNGALIGLASGAGMVFLGAVLDNRSCTGPNAHCSRPPAWFVFWAAGGMGAVGAGVGVGIDAMIHRDRAIYRRGTGARTRVAPAVGPGIRGAVVSVRW